MLKKIIVFSQLSLLFFAQHALAVTVEEQQLTDLINQYRVSNGLSVLAFDSRLYTAAQRHADDMASTGVFGYTGSDGSSPFQRIQDAGFPIDVNNGDLAVQMIAANTSHADATAQTAFDSFINSSNYQPYLLDQANINGSFVDYPWDYLAVAHAVGNWNGFSNANFWVVSVGAEASAVPLPAAAWLFGSALIGLLGVKRKQVFKS